MLLEILGVEVDGELKVAVSAACGGGCGGVVGVVSSWSLVLVGLGSSWLLCRA